MKTVYKSVRNKFVKWKTNTYNAAGTVPRYNEEKAIFIAWKQIYIVQLTKSGGYEKIDGH